MKIKFTESQMNDVESENKLVVDGELWEYIEETETDEDEQGRYKDVIYKQPSTEKYFRITLFYCRYGYKDYGYESYMQCNEAIEVERKEITTVEWRTVK